MMRVGPNASAGSEGISSSRPHAIPLTRWVAEYNGEHNYVQDCKGPMQLPTGMLPSESRDGTQIRSSCELW